MSEGTVPGPKSKSKRPGKSQKSQHVISTTSAGANGVSSSPTTDKKQ